LDKLQGKVAFITGSAGGIGLGIAQACAEAQMKVVISDIDEATLISAAAELRELGAEVLTFPLDVTDREGWARAAREVPEAIGPVQLLVNNAGISTLGLSFDEVGPELWDKVVAINLTAAYNGIRAFVDGMPAAGGGHIVNTASAGGLVGFPLLTAYSASKAALIALSESLRGELAGAGIGVTVLCPGSVRSRLWRTSRLARGEPDVEAPPDPISGGSATAKMLPHEVGRRLVEGVLADEPYVMTHPELRSVVIERHDRLLRGFDQAEAFVL
jgi:NAD(P)-dependent dehydrogenase (short-subunit alcohol dehydrogenase family)